MGVFDLAQLQRSGRWGRAQALLLPGTGLPAGAPERELVAGGRVIHTGVLFVPTPVIHLTRHRGELAHAPVTDTVKMTAEILNSGPNTHT